MAVIKCGYCDGKGQIDIDPVTEEGGTCPDCFGVGFVPAGRDEDDVPFTEFSDNGGGWDED